MIEPSSQPFLSVSPRHLTVVIVILFLIPIVLMLDPKSSASERGPCSAPPYLGKAITLPRRALWCFPPLTTIFVRLAKQNNQPWVSRGPPSLEGEGFTKTNGQGDRSTTGKRARPCPCLFAFFCALRENDCIVRNKRSQTRYHKSYETQPVLTFFTHRF